MKQWQNKVELKNENIFGVKNQKNRKNKLSVGHSDVNASDTGK
jgi:hypothetical protein